MVPYRRIFGLVEIARASSSIAFLCTFVFSLPGSVYVFITFMLVKETEKYFQKEALLKL